VRTSRAGGTKYLLTPAQAEAFDEDRHDAVIRLRALRFARSVGSSDAEFARRERDLIKQHGSITPGDVFWALATDAARQAQEREDWDRLRSIYWGQARFLYEDGRPHFHLLQEAARARLLSYAQSGAVHHVTISTAAGDGCPACARLEGTTFTIAEALDLMPIPNPSCEDGWCRCTWVPQTV
jgi:hypothetical protein